MEESQAGKAGKGGEEREREGLRLRVERERRDMLKTRDGEEKMK